MKQLRDKGEIELLFIFAGYKRYLDDGFVLADPSFEDKRYRHLPFRSPYTGAQIDGVCAIWPFHVQREQRSVKPGSTIQHKVAYLDYAVYQYPDSGLLGFHFYDKRFSHKHDAHPVLRLPDHSSFMWSQAVTGTLSGE